MADALSLRSSLLVGVVILGLAVRSAAYVTDPRPGYLAGLTAVQADMAHNIVDHGRWFVVSGPALDLLSKVQERRGGLVSPSELNLSRADRGSRFTPQVLEMPGLAVVLAASWAVTGQESYSYVKWIQILLDLVTIAAIYLIATKLSGRTVVGLLAALFYAISPAAVILAKTPSLDTWATFFIVAAVALAISTHESTRTLWRLVGLGAVIGLSAYFRPFLLLLAPLLGVACATGRPRRMVVTALVPTLVAVAFLVPWTVRNAVDFGRFIPARSGFGQALWEGLGETRNNFGAVNNDEATFELVHATNPRLRYATPAYDAFLFRKARVAIVHHPLHYLFLIVRRVIFLLPCLLAFAWPRERRYGRRLLLAVAIGTLLPYILVRIETRFWVPTSFVYFIFVAVAIDSLLLTRAPRLWVSRLARRVEAP